MESYIIENSNLKFRITFTFFTSLQFMKSQPSVNYVIPQFKKSVPPIPQTTAHRLQTRSHRILLRGVP